MQLELTIKEGDNPGHSFLIECACGCGVEGRVDSMGDILNKFAEIEQVHLEISQPLEFKQPCENDANGQCVVHRVWHRNV